MDDLNVVIVNYNSYELLSKCIESLEIQNIVPPENIIIVDNNSPDGSGEKVEREFVKCCVIRSSSNSGFGAGVNLGIGAANKNFVMVLNPDTYFAENKLGDALSEFHRDSELGILGLNLINTDGTPQYSARRFYSLFDIILRRSRLGQMNVFSRRVAQHLMMDSYGNNVFEADWVMGTGFIVRRAAFEKIGGMDEKYFLYMEDVDLCARLWINDWKVKCITTVPLVHHHQRKSNAAPFSKAGRIHLASLGLFTKKFGLPLISPPQVDGIKKKYSQTEVS